MATTISTSVNPSTQLASQDVGLIFVREYYTFLNKKPHRLHAFYNKDSLFVRGDEGTVTTTVKGQEEIRKKIEECKFEDCKVLVTQVDSQVSANNGILIQVLGEMCNQNGPSQKFSQTFFLATQPNGYFVLNDIFRFLKDEVEIDYYTCEQQEEVIEPVQQKQPETVVIDIVPSPQPVPAAAASPVPVPQPAPEQSKPVVKEEKKPEKKVDEVVKREQVKKWNEEVKKEQVKKWTEEATVPIAAETKVETTKEEAPTAAAVPVVTEEKKKSNNKSSSPSESKQPQSQQKKEQKKEQQQQQQQQQAKPSAPKTWANLTAAAPSPVTANGTVTPASAAAAAASATSEKSATAAATPSSPNVNIEKQQQSNNTSNAPVQQQQQQQQQNKSQAPRKDATNIFVKLVTEAINEDELTEAFNKIGSVKSCSISRVRSCAFIEFNSPESCQKALAIHKVTVGGNHTVLAEERRFTNQNNQNNNRYNQGGRTQNQPYERRQNTNNTNNNNNNNRRGGQTGTSRNINQQQQGKGRSAPNTTQK